MEIPDNTASPDLPEHPDRTISALIEAFLREDRVPELLKRAIRSNPKLAELLSEGEV